MGPTHTGNALGFGMVYLEGQGDLISSLIIPIPHIVTLIKGLGFGV